MGMMTPPTDRSFLGRVFDSYQNMMQISACVREAARQCSITRPRVLEVSRRDIGLSDYLPEALITRYSTHVDDRPILGNPVTLPYASKSFQVCLVSDAYEHISASMRDGLLSEMLRVTEGLVLVGCPNGNQIVSRLDRLVFDFIWGKYAERFSPLEQHVDFGTEPVEQIVERLRAQGADRVTVLPANYVYRWIHLILVYFDLQHRNPHAQLFQPFNKIYNELMSPYDYREPCYRYLVAISNTEGLQIDALTKGLTRAFEKPASLKETDEMLVQTFRELDAAAADELRRSSQEIDRLKREIGRLHGRTGRSRAERLAHRAISRFFRLLNGNGQSG